MSRSFAAPDRQAYVYDNGRRGEPVAGIELDAPLLAAEAVSSGASYLEYWALAAKACGSEVAVALADFAIRLVQSRSTWQKVVTEAIAWLPDTAPAPNGIVSDAEEDKAAWEVAARAIRAEKGSQPDLDELLQGIALRPKNPLPTQRLFVY